MDNSVSHCSADTLLYRVAEKILLLHKIFQKYNGYKDTSIATFYAKLSKSVAVSE